ncbi:MAG: hydrolase 2, exosortase A system-associated [Sedimenticolaceae bacterium]
MREAFFLDGQAGRIFCTGVRHPSDWQEGRRSAALICPPFAEEMNKARHVSAALCRALAQSGCDVLVPDLFGTGDSEGDFGDATLEVWRADIDAAIAHLDSPTSLHLIGLRAGALLAADAALRHQTKSLVLLHSQVDGRQQLTQFLRLRVAAGLMGDGEKESVSELRQILADGGTLEIAGYRLSGQLAADLESLRLIDRPPTAAMPVHWIELAPQAGRPLMPASQRVIDAWAAHGVVTRAASVVCDQFWATQEIAYCAEIVNETVMCLTG